MNIQIQVTQADIDRAIAVATTHRELFPFRFTLRNDQQMAVRQVKKTEAGAAIGRAGDKARRKARKADRQQEQLDGLTAAAKDGALPPPSPAAVKAARAATRAAKEEAASAAAEREAVLAAYHGQQQNVADDPTKRYAPPQVFKRKERHYGMRALRINKAPDA